ncbi:hypothetical protein N7452_007894 [Penicillium brevicompactum]|uniref:Azaphilone pigments biosynthesis cluster protein L N-terminal domain-containing protein n=1 Tax=Penicillium brevicompactum TaxID=5074 RepID=A0A9W9QIL5_PENBR|nr:hypothetical protein N7452_007894 [Penicillium brevicompactum]
MSGPLEAIGIAASIIQVAELGTKLSVKLFSFYREFKGANKSIQDLSSEVAITSAILHELGESLKEDEQSKLYSQTAFKTLQDVLNQCEEVLEQIRDMTKYNDSSDKTRLQQITERFRQVLLEPSLDPLKANLKRLKSTMLLLLNVIMYAGQIKCNAVPKMLQEQRDFIITLLEEKKRIEATITAAPNPITINASVNSHTALAKCDGNSEPSDLDEYSLLMQRMLREINSCKSRLEQNRHSRIKSGVLNIHSREILQFQVQHGPSILQRFDHSLFAEGIPDDASQTFRETDILTSKDSSSFETSESCNRPPSIEGLETKNGNEDNATSKNSDVKLLEPAHSTFEGDRVLMGYLAPNQPHIADIARNVPLEPFSKPEMPPDLLYKPHERPSMKLHEDIKKLDAALTEVSQNHHPHLAEPAKHPPMCLIPERDESHEKPNVQRKTSALTQPSESVCVETSGAVGTYKCTHEGCMSPPFLTQYLLK